jgi:DNA-directed RNA polymerase subunit RPC12/RpoP
LIKILLKHRTTSATVKMMSMGERIGTSVLAFVLCGAIGIALFVVPIIGWIAGLFFLMGAISIPYWCITGDKNFISKLVGNCPHCRKEVEVNNINAKDFNCSHCKQKVFIRERKFHTI